MQLIVNGLFVWLIVGVLGMGTAFISQVFRIKRMMSANSFDDARNGMSRGLLLTAVSAIVGSVSLILFLVAAIGSLVR